MHNHLPSGKLHFVEGWLPEHDHDLVALIWETRSITPEIESSLFTAEVILNTHLIEQFNSGSLEGVRSLLRDAYGPGRDSCEHAVFSHAATILADELAEV